MTDGQIDIQDLLTKIKPYVMGWVAPGSGGSGVGLGDMLKTTYDTNLDGIVDNASLLEGHNAAYFEPALTKGNLTAGSSKIAIGGTGTGALIGAGASIDVNQANMDHGSIGGLADNDHPQYALLTGAAFTGDVSVGTTLKVNKAGFRVGINMDADAQFDLDVLGNTRTGGYFVGKHAIQLPGARMICHYDGPQPVETNFSGNPTGHMGQVATVTGGVIYRPGKFGKAVQIAEATTNLAVNSSFEVDVAGWSYSHKAHVRSTVFAVYGVASLKMEVDAGQSSEDLYRTFSTSIGAAYTISMYVKLSTGAAVTNSNFKCATLNAASFINWDAILDQGNGLYRCISTQTAVGTTSYIDVQLAGSPGAFAYVDGIQAEAKPYVTPYADGSLGVGYSFSGTAHASTSSRTNAIVSYSKSIIDLNRGSVSAWVHLPPNVTDRVIFEVTGGGNYCELVLASTKTYGYWGTTLVTYSTAIAAGWHMSTMTFDGTTVCIYLDGIQVATGAGNTFTATTDMFVGNISGGTVSLNGMIDDLVILDRAMSAAEVRAVYESNAPVFAETSSWGFRTANTLAWADEFGLWTTDASGNAAFGVSGVNSKSWGALTLDAGDVLIGKDPSYFKWDASANAVTLHNANLATVSTGDADNFFSWTNTDITTYTSAFGFLNLQKTARYGGTIGSFNIGLRLDANNQTILGHIKDYFIFVIQSGGTYYFPLEVKKNTIKLEGLTDYANNAAALAGGKGVGDLYTETGTNPKRVCIVV